MQHPSRTNEELLTENEFTRAARSKTKLGPTTEELKQSNILIQSVFNSSQDIIAILDRVLRILRELRVLNTFLNQRIKALRKSKSDLLWKNKIKSMLFNSSLEAVAVFGGTPPKVIAINPAFSRMFGYSEEEMLAFSADDIFKLVYPEDRVRVRNSLYSKFNQELTFNRYEFRSLTKDGRLRWLEVSASMAYSDGKQLFSQAIYRDITERKQKEKEQSQLISELQRALSGKKRLRGMLPICASCKKIRDDNGHWQPIDSYIEEHSEAAFNHGICPECTKKLIEEYYKSAESSH